MSQRLSPTMSSRSSPRWALTRVGARQLLVEVLGEHLDVAGLVHHLGGGVVLGVDPRDGLDDLGGADQRALLAVHELAEHPVLRLHAELGPLLIAPALEERAAQVDAAPAVGGGVGDDHRLLVDLDRPVEVGLAVPLGGLGLLVELLEAGPGPLLVVPGEDGVGVVLHGVDRGLDVGVGHVHDVGVAGDHGPLPPTRCQRVFAGGHVSSGQGEERVGRRSDDDPGKSGPSASSAPPMVPGSAGGASSGSPWSRRRATRRSSRG